MCTMEYELHVAGYYGICFGECAAVFPLQIFRLFIKRNEL